MFLHHALQLLAAAAPDDASPVANVVSLVITSVVSATVFSALITGLVQYLINRRNSRITERKNTVDAESDVVERYRVAAAEERAQKESAVRTIQELLSESKESIISLKGTVETLNNTIALMKDLNTAQADVIQQLTHDRDRQQAALTRAQARIDAQKEELRKKQEEIQALLQNTHSREEAARIVSQSFNLTGDAVE